VEIYESVKFIEKAIMLRGAIVKRHIVLENEKGVQGTVQSVTPEVVQQVRLSPSMHAQHSCRAVVPFDSSTSIVSNSEDTSMIRAGDILFGINDQDFVGEVDFEKKWRKLTAPWHFGNRIFKLNLLRCSLNPADVINHMRFVHTFENEHNFWMYNRVENKLDTVAAIKEHLGLGLRRRCIMRGHRKYDYDHALNMNHNIAFVASVGGKAAKVGIKVGDIIYRINGKRPHASFPPVLSTRTTSNQDETMFDDEGHKIGVIELTVLREDIEQVDCFEQSARRSLCDPIPELQEMGCNDRLTDILKEADSAIQLQERRKYFTRLDQVASKLQLWARNLLLRWYTRSTVQKLKNLTMANVHDTAVLLQKQSTDPAVLKLAKWNGTPPPQALPPAKACLSKKLLQELVNDTNKNRNIDVGSPLTTFHIRDVLSYTRNHYGEALLALKAQEQRMRKGRMTVLSMKDSTQFKKVLNNDNNNYDNLTGLTIPQPCRKPQIVGKRGAITTLHRCDSLRQRRERRRLMEKRRSELECWKGEMEVEQKSIAFKRILYRDHGWRLNKARMIGDYRARRVVDKRDWKKDAAKQQLLENAENLKKQPISYRYCKTVYLYLHCTRLKFACTNHVPICLLFFGDSLSKPHVLKTQVVATMFAEILTSMAFMAMICAESTDMYNRPNADNPWFLLLSVFLQVTASTSLSTIMQTSMNFHAGNSPFHQFLTQQPEQGKMRRFTRLLRPLTIVEEQESNRLRIAMPVLQTLRHRILTKKEMQEFEEIEPITAIEAALDDNVSFENNKEPKQSNIDSDSGNNTELEQENQENNTVEHHDSLEATKINIDLKGFEKQSSVQGPAARSNSKRGSFNPKDTSVIDVVVVGDADCDNSDDDHTAEDATDNEEEDPYSPEVLARVKQRRIKQALADDEVLLRCMDTQTRSKLSLLIEDRLCLKCAICHAPTALSVHHVTPQRKHVQIRHPTMTFRECFPQLALKSPLDLVHQELHLYLRSPFHFVRSTSAWLIMVGYIGFMAVVVVNWGTNLSPYMQAVWLQNVIICLIAQVVVLPFLRSMSLCFFSGFLSGLVCTIVVVAAYYAFVFCPETVPAFYTIFLNQTPPDWEPICSTLPIQLWNPWRFTNNLSYPINMTVNDQIAPPLLLNSLFGWDPVEWLNFIDEQYGTSNAKE
jgi:hypothetical protein